MKNWDSYLYPTWRTGCYKGNRPFVVWLFRDFYQSHQCCSHHGFEHEKRHFEQLGADRRRSRIKSLDYATGQGRWSAS